MSGRMRFPVWVGVIVGIVGSCFALYLTYSAPAFPDIRVRFVLYMISIGCLIFFPHSLAHYVVGTCVGVHFTNYSLGRSAIGRLNLPLISTAASKLPVLTIRIDHASLRSVTPNGRIAMFASGAVCSMVLPLIAVAASFNQLPPVLSIFLLVACLGNLIFDIYYSPKAGDLSRIKATRKA